MKRVGSVISRKLYRTCCPNKRNSCEMNARDTGLLTELLWEKLTNFKRGSSTRNVSRSLHLLGASVLRLYTHNAVQVASSSTITKQLRIKNEYRWGGGGETNVHWWLVADTCSNDKFQCHIFANIFPSTDIFNTNGGGHKRLATRNIFFDLSAARGTLSCVVSNPCDGSRDKLETSEAIFFAFIRPCVHIRWSDEGKKNDELQPSFQSKLKFVSHV